MNRILRQTVLAVVMASSLPVFAAAEVSRVEVISRRDVAGGRLFGSSGSYEQITGRPC